jgi:hypothetical protein
VVFLPIKAIDTESWVLPLNYRRGIACYASTRSVTTIGI